MAKAEKGGGKLGRTETVTIRLDPKTNYLAELAARIQRRTKSSFIESAVAQAIDAQPLLPRDPETASLGEMAERLWHVRDHERLISLVEHAPHLMNYEEQQIWALISEHCIFWTGRYRDRKDGTEEFEWTVQPSSLRRDMVAEHWENLVKVANGSIPKTDLPSAEKTRTKAKFEIDDDLPF